MKIIKFPIKNINSLAVILIETQIDLFHLSKIINIGDLIEAKTYRIFKISEKKEDKKKVTICINVEFIEFNKFSQSLRIRGKIVSGFPEEYVQLGSYHSLDIKINDKIKIKKFFRDYEIFILKKAVEKSQSFRLMIIGLDEESANFAHFNEIGLFFEDKKIKNMANKRSENFSNLNNQYFLNIYEIISDFLNKEEQNIILIAGPGFAKEDLTKFIKNKDPKLLKQIKFESCSNAKKSGILELFRMGKISKIIKETYYLREFSFIEEFKKNLGKENGLYCYGLKQVEFASKILNIEKIMISFSFLKQNKKAQEIYEACEKKNVKTILVLDDSENIDFVNSFAKILAILRYKID